MIVATRIESVKQAKSALNLRNLDWYGLGYSGQYVPRQVFDLLQAGADAAGIGIDMLEEGVVDLIHSGRYDDACASLARWDDLGLFDDPVFAYVPIHDAEDRRVLAGIVLSMTDDEKSEAGIRWSPFWNVRTLDEAKISRRKIAETARHLDEAGAW